MSTLLKQLVKAEGEHGANAKKITGNEDPFLLAFKPLLIHLFVVKMMRVIVKIRIKKANLVKVVILK